MSQDVNQRDDNQFNLLWRKHDMPVLNTENIKTVFLIPFVGHCIPMLCDGRLMGITIDFDDKSEFPTVEVSDSFEKRLLPSKPETGATPRENIPHLQFGLGLMLAEPLRIEGKANRAILRLRRLF
jgi:hypothetical protein